MNNESKNDPAAWSTTYALSLTKYQWTEELRKRFFDTIIREVESFPSREPVRLVVDQLSLETDEDPFYNKWKIHGVSVSPDTCSLYLTAVFWGSTAPYTSAKENTIGAKPLFEADGNEGEMYVFGVEAILHIDNAARLSSEIVDVVVDTDSLDNSDTWSYETDDDCILALVG
jgi:hypothetical protein